MARELPEGDLRLARAGIVDAVDVGPDRLLARGRMADVFDAGPGLVLRRYRDPRLDATPEASTMTYLHGIGYPVPQVMSVDGPDLLMQRLNGPTMLSELTRHPWRLSACALLLADLHTRLSRIEAPASLPTPVGSGTAMLHLDLHPDNVILTDSGPMVIDWTNACRGPAPADVANTWLLLKCARPAGARLARALVAVAAGLLTRRFVDAAGAPAARQHLRSVYAYRSLDKNMSGAELDRMQALVRRETGGPSGGDSVTA